MSDSTKIDYNRSRYQLENRNYLLPAGVEAVLSAYPKVTYFGQRAQFPGLVAPSITQHTYLKGIPQVGDVGEFGVLTLDFKVDEDMVNYNTLFNWMYGLTFPQTQEQLRGWLTQQDGTISYENERSDGSVFLLDRNLTRNIEYRFEGLWPTQLSGISMDVTGSNMDSISATVQFEFTAYNMFDAKTGKMLAYAGLQQQNYEAGNE